MSVLTDKDILRWINRKNLVIFPFEKALTTGVGYDLRIGAIEPLNKFDEFKREDGKVIIPPHCHCMIITKEFVWLSEGLVGTLHTRATLAARGLYLNSTSVDPNFKGQMVMSAVNLSNESIELDENAHYLTLIYHRVNHSTKTKLGKEGDIKAMKVLEDFRNNIFRPKSPEKLYVLENEAINKLSNYLNSCHLEHGDEFENLIHYSRYWSIQKVKDNIYRYISGFIKKSLVSILISVLIFLSIAAAIWYLYRLFVSKTINSDEARAIFVALAAILSLLVTILSRLEK